ncbi:MAG: heparinase II/III family protein [Rhodobacterales bacterium]
MSFKISELVDQLKRNREARQTQSVAWRTRRGKAARAFVSQPVSRNIGSAQKGLQIAAGNFLINGRLIRDPNVPIWDVDSENDAFQIKAQSFYWLDDLAANGSPECNLKARAWFADWLIRFGDGDNFAWTPELAGMRIIRLVNHALVFLTNTKEQDQKNYFASISHHARFLKKRRLFAPDGLPRFQALVGSVYSALALENFAGDLKPALRTLARECDSYISDDGGISSRNPEELLMIFTLLVWVDQGMTRACLKPDRALLNAIERIAPALHSLRMPDGRLVEFHGGGASNVAHIDLILSGYTAPVATASVMGYSRIKRADSLLIVDTGAAPKSDSLKPTYDCALALEFASGPYTIFNSTGFKSPGRGHDLSTAQPSAAAFSVSSLKPVFSGTAGHGHKLSNALAADMFVEAHCPASADDAPVTLAASHTGYLKDFGLTYRRTLDMAPNGRVITGLDRFYCQKKPHKSRYDAAVGRQVAHSIAFVAIFHISPDVEAELDLGGMAVSLQLPNNVVWIFKAPEGALALQDSVYFDQDHLMPRATKQIVVTSQVVNYEGAVTWMLARIDG